MAKTLVSLFPKKPSNELFQGVWIWNSLLTKTEIERQLEQFKEKQLTTILLRPGADCEPAFLSQDYLVLLNHALACAAKHSIQIRLVESLSGGAPSFAAQLATEHRQYRLETVRFLEQANVRATKAYSKTIANPENTLIYAVRMNEAEIEPSSLRKLNSAVNGNQLSWPVPHGEWVILFFSRQEQYLPLAGYQIDFFNPAVVSKYVAGLFDTYKRAVESKYWGKTLGGFVFELPHVGPAANEFFWSAELQRRIRSKLKQDFDRVLPALLLHAGKRTGVIRNQTYTFLIQTTVQTLAQPLLAGAKKNGMHCECYWSDVNPYYPDESLQLIPQTRDAALLSGIQTVRTSIPEPAAFSKLRYRNLETGQKVVRTFLGRNNSFSSSSLQSLRYEIDQQVLRGGRNWVIDGLNIAPTPKVHPFVASGPTVFSPLWSCLDRLLDYTRMFCALAQESTLNRQALLLYPRASLLAAYTPLDTSEYEKIRAVVNDCCNLLSKLGIGYDVADEEAFWSAENTAKGLAVKSFADKTNYSMIVLPRVSLLSRKTLDVVKKASALGTPVLWMSVLPVGILEDGVNPAVRKQLEDFRKKQPTTFKVFELTSAAENDLRAVSQSTFKSVGGERPVEEIETAHFRGKHDIFVVLNASETAAKSMDVQIQAPNKIYLAEIDKQEVYKFPKAQSVNEGHRFNLDLQPRQAMVLLASKSNLTVAKGHLFELIAGLERKYRIVFKNHWDFKPDSANLLPLSFWNMRISGSTENSGFFRFMETYFEVEELPKPLNLVLHSIVNQPIEVGSPFLRHLEIAVNGVKLKEFQARSFYGESTWQPSVPVSGNSLFGPRSLETDISGFIQKGFNRISVRTVGNYYTPECINYPLFLKGEFALTRGSRGWVLCNPLTAQEYASWAEHGYPYFSGTGTYKQTFERPDAFRRLVIKFRKVEEVAMLKINGQLVAVFPFEPMEVDVTNLTLQGKNEIAVQVLNTLDNAVKLNSRSSGLTGEIFLDVY